MRIKNFTDVKSLLLNNKTIKQTIFKNIFWLVVAESLSKFLKLILIIYVARILGAREYGKFTFALAFVTLFAIFSDLGIFSVTIREFSQDKEREKKFPSVLSLKILLSLGTLFLILIGSFFITPDPLIRRIIWILGIYVILSSFSGIIFAFFQARQKMEYEAWARIFEVLIITLAGFFVILNFPSIKNLSYSYLFASLAVLFFILIFFHFKVYRLRLSWKKSLWKNYLAMSWPLALAGVFSTIYASTDSIMMGYWGQVTQTGWYNAAYKIIGVTLIPAALISASFFPALSLAFRKEKERFQKIWDYQMEMVIFLTIPLVVGGITLAPKIIGFIYNPSYFPSILAFQILIVVAGISFFCNPFSQILVVANQQRKAFWIALFGAIINVILNIILIPKYSLYGAAIATVITFLLIFFLFFKFTIRLTSIKPLNIRFISSFIGVCLASSLMYFVVSQPQIYQLNVFFSILTGTGVYLVCFLGYKKLVNQFLNFS